MQPPDPDMAPGLGGFWDAYLRGDEGEAAHIDPESAETVRRLHQRDTTPAPDAAAIARIWETALQASGVTVPLTVTHPERVVSTNGHHAAKPATLTVVAAAPVESRSFRRHASGAVRAIGIGALAGIVAGAIAGGLGSRVAMYIVGLTAEPWQRGLLTENQERVGEFTVDGTLGLIVFFGALVGMVVGLAFMAVRPWLPWSGMRRGAVFGLLLFLLGGQALFEGGENTDYQRFGYVGLNLCLFGVLPILFGLIIGPLADLIEQRIDHTLPRRGQGPFLSSLGLIVVAALAVSMIPLLVMLAPPIGFIMIALPIARLAINRWAVRFNQPGDLLQRPRVAFAAYGLLAAPSLVGLVLTLQAIGRILSGT